MSQLALKFRKSNFILSNRLRRFPRCIAQSACSDSGLGRVKTRTLILFTLLCAAIAHVQIVHAAIIQVTSGNDSGPGTLRHALANADDGDTIQLFPNFIPGMEVVLTSGQLLVNKSVSIVPVNRSVQVPVRRSPGTPAFRIFHITPGKTVNISGLIITNGLPSNDTAGGGILNDHATLAISRCAVSGNSNSGIFNDTGTLTINHCTISGNNANTGGGGILAGYSFGERLTAMTVTINNSTITGNSAVRGGGGIFVFSGNSTNRTPTLRIHRCTISANSQTGPLGDGGGGIFLFGPGLFDVLVVNSTLSGNSANSGRGAIGRVANGTVRVVHCTVAGNSAPSVGGISGCIVGNTILKTGPMGRNVSGGRSLGYNLSDDNGNGVLTAPGDQINTHPLLGPLQDNGGPTLTHSPLPGSPAIDRGDPDFTPPPEFDQRGDGYPRVVNGRLDIGAIEVQ